MKKVYRITLWHGEKGSVWQTDQPPKVESNGIFRFKCQDGLVHWVSGTVEVTEFEEAG
ncbi:MAG: hypothetical protein GY851_23490 [bacterium]|nr:hypothetical protein [bacterium]